MLLQPSEGLPPGCCLFTLTLRLSAVCINVSECVGCARHCCAFVVVGLSFLPGCLTGGTVASAQTCWSQNPISAKLLNSVWLICFSTSTFSNYFVYFCYWFCLLYILLFGCLDKQISPFGSNSDSDSDRSQLQTLNQ